MTDEDIYLLPLGYFEWTRVIRSVDLPSTTKLVAYATAFFADTKTGGRAHPGQARLARETGLSERAIRTHQATLEDAGLLWRKTRGSGGATGARLAAVYQLTVPQDVHEFLEAVEDVPVALPTRPANRNYVPVWSTGKPEPRASKPESDDSKPEPRSAYLSNISSEIPPSARRQATRPRPRVRAAGALPV